jgi:hypothetical protein
MSEFYPVEIDSISTRLKKLVDDAQMLAETTTAIEEAHVI